MKLKLNDTEAKNLLRRLRDGRANVATELSRDALLYAIEAIEDRAALLEVFPPNIVGRANVSYVARRHMCGQE